MDKYYGIRELFILQASDQLEDKGKYPFFFELLTSNEKRWNMELYLHFVF